MSCTPLDSTLQPLSTSPERVSEEIRSILAQLPFVRGIALFGSLAEGRADRWSDVDMIVACNNVETDAWAAASAIRSAKLVLFYRKFGAMAQPAGRYWFGGESAFHKLDVSFYSMDEYESRMNGSDRIYYPITTKEIYRSTTADCALIAARATIFAEPATESESQIGSHIYFSLRAVKRFMRKEALNDTDMRGVAGLRDALASLPSGSVMTGGRIGELAHQVGKILEQSGLE